MAAAIIRSKELGNGGALWLESLPGASAFYESLGMIQQPRKSADGYSIFLLSPSEAEQLLEKIKQNGIVHP